MSDEELAELLADLASDDLTMRTAVLHTLAMAPSGDPRILPVLERLLADRTPCLVQIPYLFGELCWLAAYALAAERAACGIAEPVRLLGVARPLSTEELGRFEQAAGMRGRAGVDGLVEVFGKLDDLGRVPRCDLVLDPSDSLIRGQR